jgi:hypothetical protein
MMRGIIKAAIGKIGATIRNRPMNNHDSVCTDSPPDIRPRNQTRNNPRFLITAIMAKILP